MEKVDIPPVFSGMRRGMLHGQCLAVSQLMVVLGSIFSLYICIFIHNITWDVLGICHVRVQGLIEGCFCVRWMVGCINLPKYIMVIY